jgi:2-dehydropantoate 2-reductase
MHFIVVGAGAIGGAFAAHMIRQGHDAVLVEHSQERVEAIKARGLNVTGKETFSVHLRIVEPGEIAGAISGAPEFVVLAVKSQYTIDALQPLLPLLGKDSAVVSMQNGLNPKVIAGLVGAERTIGTFLNTMGAYSINSGEIVFSGPGNVYIGELDGSQTARTDELAESLRASFAKKVTVTPNIWGCLWGKASYATMFFLSAVSDTEMSVVTSDPETLPLLANISGEVISIARLENIKPQGFDGYEPELMWPRETRDWGRVRSSWLSVSRVTAQSSKPKSGIWIDLAVRKCATEVDYMIGLVNDVAAKHGVTLPLLKRLVDMVHEIERGERALGKQNLAELRALNAATYA